MSHDESWQNMSHVTWAREGDAELACDEVGIFSSDTVRGALFNQSSVPSFPLSALTPSPSFFPSPPLTPQVLLLHSCVRVVKTSWEFYIVVSHRYFHIPHTCSTRRSRNPRLIWTEQVLLCYPLPPPHYWHHLHRTALAGGSASRQSLHACECVRAWCLREDVFVCVHSVSRHTL